MNHPSRVRLAALPLAALSLGLVACAGPQATGPAPTGRPSTATSPEAASSTPNPTPQTITPPTWQGALTLAPVTHVKPSPPTGFVPPKCPRPRTTVGTISLSPAANLPKGHHPAEKSIEPGTNHSPEADAYVYPAATVQGWITGTVPQPTDKKIAFLTFDDGPTGVTTPQVLKVLTEQHAHATFFTIARQVDDTTGQLLRAEIAQGSAVAIHSYGHGYSYLYPHRTGSVTNIACDIDWAQATLQAVLGDGYRTQVTRYPGGHMSWKGLTAADAAEAKRGHVWLDWNAMDGDADASVPHTTAADMVANIPRTLNQNKPDRRNVAVILMHDMYPNQKTVDALPKIIENLRAQGYVFGVIS